MGRRKLEMKKIENLEARRVCFTKRRQGLFKKAAKLSKDHNLKILSIVFSPAGKPFVFSSGNPSISFDSMLQNFLLNGSSSSSSSIPVVENDSEHCSTSYSVDETTIDLVGTLNVEEEEEQTRVSSIEGISDSIVGTLNAEEEQTRVSSIEGILDSSFQFGEIQQPLSDFEIKNPNLLCTNFELGGFEEELTPIDLEGIWDSSVQFGEIIQPLSGFEIENPNFEMDGFEEQTSCSVLDVEDYYYMEEIRSTPVLLGAEDNNYGVTTDLSQIQFGEEYGFDPLLLDTNLYDNNDATAAAIFQEVFQ